MIDMFLKKESLGGYLNNLKPCSKKGINWKVIYITNFRIKMIL
ncbi:hypothetical protein PCZ31_1768 [Clostridioides difficile]|nr:hypothetical protein PCZ31_1768 [Clostridioides difficile]